MGTVTLKLNLNLQNLSSIVVATNLWEHEEITKEVKQYFADANINADKSKDDHKWHEIVQRVSGHINLLSLPEELHHLLYEHVKYIGEKVYYWNMYLLINLHLSQDYANKIYWTSFGTIDESKTFDLYWAPLSQGKLRTSSCHDNNLDMLFLSCLFYRKNYLEKHFKELLRQIEIFFAPIKILDEECTIHTLILISLCIFFTDNKNTALELYSHSKESDETDTDMFFYCLLGGYQGAAKYFWSRLIKEDKEQIIIQGAENCIRNFDRNGSYEEKSIEILIFLINNMTTKEREDFMTESIPMAFRFFLHSWPYHEMAFQIVDEFGKYINERHVLHLVRYNLIAILDDIRSKKYISKDTWRQVLPKIFRMLPKHMKMRVVATESLLSLLFDKFDISVLSLILNDEDLSDIKEKVLKFGNQKFKTLIKSKNFALLNTFIQKAFALKSEKKEFKLKINALPDLLCEGNFSSADEMLNWLTNSDEEKIQIKKEIDPIKVWCESKTFNYELVDKILDWLHDAEGAEEKRNIVKQAMKTNEFICDKIAKIWNANPNSKEAETKCLQFLQFLSDTEDATELKKNLIIDENIVKSFCNSLPDLESFVAINDLFEFLSVPSQTVLEIKEKIVNNIGEWISTYVVDQKSFKLIEAIFIWLFSSECKKKKVLKNYINSSEGAILIRNAYLNSKDGYTETFSFVLNSWVMLYGNVHEIVNKLSAIELEGFLDACDIGKLIFLLMWVQGQGQPITEDDINSVVFDGDHEPLFD